MKLKSKSLKGTISKVSQEPTSSLLDSKDKKTTKLAKGGKCGANKNVNSIDLENEDGILATLETTKSKSIHLRVIEYKGRDGARLDIRQFNTHSKYTGYTSKGVSISVESLELLRDYIDQIIVNVENGEIEPLEIDLNN